MSEITKKLVVSASPHFRAADTTTKIMLDVIIALIPACLAGIYFFGLRALVVILTAIASCVLSEYIFQKIMKKKVFMICLLMEFLKII